MTNTFVRFYLAVVLAYLALFAGGVLFLWWGDEEHDVRVIEDSLAAGARLAADRLRDPRGRAAALSELRTVFEEDVALVGVEQAPPGANARPHRQVRFYEGPDGEGFVATNVDRTTLLVVGPLKDWAEPGLWRYSTLLLVVLGSLALLLLALMAPLVRERRALQDAASKLAAGDWSVRVQERGSRDQVALARTFNHMIDQLARLLESQRELFQAVSHELRTPLARLRFRIELLQDAGDAATRARHVSNLDDDLMALDDLVEELLTYAKVESGAKLRRDELEVAQELSAVLRERSGQPGQPQPQLVCEVSQGTQLPANRKLFARAVGNLVTNALRHASERVEVRARVDGEMVEVAVHDDGPGIPMALRERAFEAFERLDESTRSNARGTGLGLTIVRSVVRAHGGDACVVDSPLGGCAIATRWPLQAR